MFCFQGSVLELSYTSVFHPLPPSLLPSVCLSISLFLPLSFHCWFLRSGDLLWSLPFSISFFALITMHFLSFLFPLEAGSVRKGLLLWAHTQTWARPNTNQHTTQEVIFHRAKMSEIAAITLSAKTFSSQFSSKVDVSAFYLWRTFRLLLLAINNTTHLPLAFYNNLIVFDLLVTEKQQLMSSKQGNRLVLPPVWQQPALWTYVWCDGRSQAWLSERKQHPNHAVCHLRRCFAVEANWFPLCSRLTLEAQRGYGKKMQL